MSSATFATCPACGRFGSQASVVWAPLFIGDDELHLHLTCGTCRSTRIQTAVRYDRLARGEFHIVYTNTKRATGGNDEATR